MDEDEITQPQGGETAIPHAEQTPAAEGEAAQGAGSDDAGSGEGSPKEGGKDGGNQPDEKEKEFKRLKRRNERLLQERAVERSERERLAAELARLQQKATQEEAEDGETKPQPKTEDPREIAREMRLVEKTAERLRAVEKKAPEGFDKAVAELVTEVGPLLDKAGRPSPLLEAVLDSDRAAEVMVYLGENAEEAAELVGLSPARLGRRIAQIESDLAAKAKKPNPSAAAKPLSPVKPSAAVTVDPAKLTDKQWAELRRKERLAR